MSVYADDVHIFICSQEEVQCFQEALSMYEKASSAQCVEAKSEAPLLGVWRAQAVPCLHRGFKEGSESVGVVRE